MSRLRVTPKLSDLPACHVLSIHVAERAGVATMLKVVAGRPILTVSDIEGFVDVGGTLGLVMVDGRIRFDANRDAARIQGLQLRAQLLSLARVARCKRGPIYPGWAMARKSRDRGARCKHSTP